IPGVQPGCRVAPSLLPPFGGAGEVTFQPRHARVQAIPLFHQDPAALPAEVNAWLGLLPAWGRARAAAYFLTGRECRGNLTRAASAALLPRPADAAGFNGLLSAGLGATAIRVTLESTLEFFQFG